MIIQLGFTEISSFKHLQINKYNALYSSKKCNFTSGEKSPISRWGSPIPCGDGDGDVITFPSGDGDGDGDGEWGSGTGMGSAIPDAPGPVAIPTVDFI